MRALALLYICMLFLAGCASNRPASAPDTWWIWCGITTGEEVHARLGDPYEVFVTEGESNWVYRYGEPELFRPLAYRSPSVIAGCRDMSDHVLTVTFNDRAIVKTYGWSRADRLTVDEHEKRQTKPDGFLKKVKE